MDFLKEILGEDLYSQTKEKVDSYNQEHKDKPLKLVNLSEGAYVSKEKFDSKETELKNLNEQLTNANNEIKSYKDMDIDSIKKSASDWEGKYNKLLEEQENAKNEEIRSQRTNDFFKDIKFSCESAKAGVMAKFKEKDFKYDEKAGKYQGANEWLEEIKKNDAGAFLSDVANPTYTTNPKTPGNTSGIDELREAMGISSDKDKK